MRSPDAIRTALATRHAEGKVGTAAVRMLAAGRGWRAVDVLCTSGPSDYVFEERRTFFSVAVVLAGSFTYRSGREPVALLPGCLLLGNAGECFECSHAHGEGDRCLAFHFDPDVFESLWSGFAGAARRPSFPRIHLPYSPALAGIWAAAELFVCGGASPGIEELALEVAAIAVAAGGTPNDRSHRLHSHQIRRVSETVRFIAENLDQDLKLDMLADSARMSRFGFVRCFKRITGITPHSYIRGRRIGEAAVRLRTTTQPIANVALDVGFADLSTFNAAFRTTMGKTPSAYRLNGR